MLRKGSPSPSKLKKGIRGSLSQVCLVLANLFGSYMPSPCSSSKGNQQHVSTAGGYTCRTWVHEVQSLSYLFFVIWSVPCCCVFLRGVEESSRLWPVKAKMLYLSMLEALNAVWVAYETGPSWHWDWLVSSGPELWSSWHSESWTYVWSSFADVASTWTIASERKRIHSVSQGGHHWALKAWCAYTWTKAWGECFNACLVIFGGMKPQMVGIKNPVILVTSHRLDLLQASDLLTSLSSSSWPGSRQYRD